VTVADWVARESSGVPVPLLDAVLAALGSSGGEPAAEAFDVLLELAERRLADLLAHDVLTREGAVPLLTIDAIVTWMLEAAADRPDEIDERSRRAMLRLSALA
jgi:hypothetical protein